MKPIWLKLKKHPMPVICYLFFLLICYSAIKNSLYLNEQMKLHPERGGIVNGGEAAGITSAMTYLVGFIFLLVSIMRGGSKNGDSTFYLWFALAVIIPMIIAGNASEFIK